MLVLCNLHLKEMVKNKDLKKVLIKKLDDKTKNKIKKVIKM
jgi:hypothetical protein